MLFGSRDHQKISSEDTSDYYGLYGHLFVKREITGRSLVRMKESSLARIGVSNPRHRDELYRAIQEEKLHCKDLEEEKKKERKEVLRPPKFAIMTAIH